MKKHQNFALGRLKKFILLAVITALALTNIAEALTPKRWAQCAFQAKKYNCTAKEKATAKKWLIAGSVAVITATAAAAGIAVKAAQVKEAKSKAAQEPEMTPEQEKEEQTLLLCVFNRNDVCPGATDYNWQTAAQKLIPLIPDEKAVEQYWPTATNLQKRIVLSFLKEVKGKEGKEEEVKELEQFFISFQRDDLSRIQRALPEKALKVRVPEIAKKALTHLGPGDEFFSWFEIFKVRKNAPRDIVRQAFKNLLLQYHPDKTRGKPEELQKAALEASKVVNEAYQKYQAVEFLLMDTEKQLRESLELLQQLKSPKVDAVYDAILQNLRLKKASLNTSKNIALSQEQLVPGTVPRVPLLKER